MKRKPGHKYRPPSQAMTFEQTAFAFLDWLQQKGLRTITRADFGRLMRDPAYAAERYPKIPLSEWRRFIEAFAQHAVANTWSEAENAQVLLWLEAYKHYRRNNDNEKE